MTDDSTEWDDLGENNDLNSLPKDWQGFSRMAKVQRIVDVIQFQIRKVRCGNFDVSKASQVSALCLEGLMELADFYADTESNAKNAKHMVEYIEGERAISYKKEMTEQHVKVSETELKRVASCSNEVKDARLSMITMEKEYKKWRYVYETLNEAHVFFRNIGKM